MGEAAIWDPKARYKALLERAAADPAVVGVVVFGSRGIGAFVTDDSDFDAFVIVDGPEQLSYPYATNHGDPVEVWPITLEKFRVHALSGGPDEWNRPAFLTARVDLDRLDGEIARLVQQKAELSPDEATHLAKTALDDYINSLYRALRNLEGSRDLEGRLDAAQSVGPMLTTTFALDGRVRPFNKWLRHELARRPLRVTSSAVFVDAVDAVVADPSPETLRIGFRLVEVAARKSGLDAVVDGWEPDVVWLRGSA